MIKSLMAVHTLFNAQEKKTEIVKPNSRMHEKEKRLTRIKQNV